MYLQKPVPAMNVAFGESMWTLIRKACQKTHVCTCVLAIRQTSSSSQTSEYYMSDVSLTICTKNVRYYVYLFVTAWSEIKKEIVAKLEKIDKIQVQCKDP